MDKKISLAKLELERIDWSKLRASSGFADYVPSVMNALLNAKTPDEVNELYWKIDNNLFIQRQLFESAEYLVPVLVASLLEVQGSFIKYQIYDLLFEIVAGFPHQFEVALDNYDIAERCREKAREGLWILYKLLIDGDEIDKESALEILKQIETDTSRLEAFLSKANFK